MSWDKKPIHEMATVTALGISIVALPYSIPLCHFGIFLLILNWVIEGNWNEKWKQLKSNPLALGFICFFLWCLAGLLFTNNTENGWFNIEKKFTLATVPLILSTIKPLTKKHINVLFMLFIGSCFIGTLICLGTAFYRLESVAKPDLLNFDYLTTNQYLSINQGASSVWHYFSYRELASGIEIHPAYFATYLTFCVFLLYYFYTDRELTKINGMTLVITLLVFYFTGFVAMLSTRITFITLLPVIFLIPLIYIIKKRTLSLQPVIMSLVLIGLFISLTALNPISRYRNFQEIEITPLKIEQNRQYTNSTEIRLSLWWLGIKTISDMNWLTGYGTGDVGDEMKRTSDQFGISNLLHTYDPHNQFLYTAMGLGLIGVCLLAFTILFPVARAWTQTNYLHVAFILLIFACCLTESFIESQKGIVFFVLFQCLLSFHFSIREQLQST
jgi:O-antigen ligase